MSPRRRAAGRRRRALPLPVWPVALALAACARGPEPVRAPIDADECYRLSYDDRERADTTFFPRALRLAAGDDQGTVAPVEPAAADTRFWSMIALSAGWRRTAGDSLAVTFGNGVSATDLVVAHDGERLAGAARFRFGPDSEPYPILAVRGRRVDCDGAQ